MKTNVQTLNDVFQTGREMARLTCLYWPDLGRWLDVPFLLLYRHVCHLPYIDDPDDIETVARPAFTLRPDWSPRDCDDKAVICACWWHGHGVPVRFVSTSTRPDKVLHHVFLQVYGMGFVDATLDEFAGTLGKYDYFEAVTNFQPLTKWF